MISQIFRRLFGAALLGIAVLSTPARAQNQPDQPVAIPEQFQAYANLMAQTSFALQQQSWPAALASSKAAFAAASNDDQRLEAARLVASAHFRAGHFGRAEWWLRRALNFAGDPARIQAVRQDFAIVRQNNPLQVQLSFSAAPNNNINNGSSSESITIWNLPFILSADAQALAGYEVSGSVELRYRLAQSQQFATDAGLLLHSRFYELSASAAAAAPTANASDYAFSVAEAFLLHTRSFADLPGPTSFSLNLGKNWYGGNPHTDYARVSVAQSFGLSPTTALQFSASTERQINHQSGGVSSNIHSLSGSVSHQLASSDQIGGSVRVQETTSIDPGAENTTLRLGVNYGIAKPVLGMQLSFSLTAEQRDYEFSIYDITGRQDLTLSVSATALFTNVAYFGFSPTMSIEANQTQSNVSLFDRETVALRFGVQSVF